MLQRAGDLIVEQTVWCEARLQLDSEVCVTPIGELDRATATSVHRQLDALRAAGFCRVVLDVRELAIDDTAMDLIAALERAARDGQWRLSLIDQSPALRERPGRDGAALAIVDRAEQRLADGRVVTIVSEPASVRWACTASWEAHPAVAAGALADAIADTLGYALSRPAQIGLLAGAITDPGHGRREGSAGADDGQAHALPAAPRSVSHDQRAAPVSL